MTSAASQPRSVTRRTAVITGANRGIGRATAVQLARDGLDVILTYNSHREEADAVVQSIGALGRKAVALQLDVGNVESFESFAREVSGAARSVKARRESSILPPGEQLVSPPAGGRP